MRNRIQIPSAVVICLLFMTVLGTGCVSRTMSRIHGNKVASCKGKIDLTKGGNTRFAFEIYRKNDGSFISYFKAGHLKRFRPVRDLSFNDGTLNIEVGSPRRVYEGSLIMDSLSFEGELKQLTGLFSSGRGK
ncbi:hypothetical protein ACFL6P_05355 [Candidatus Latescibacterota bacterium]